jgi:hypothetical protein
MRRSLKAGKSDKRAIEQAGRAGAVEAAEAMNSDRAK